MPRLIAVGDIHGQYTKLINLVEMISPKPGDQIVFLGDYVDGGPQSANVIEYLRRQSAYRKWWFLMGNHDSWFLDYLESGVPDPAWLINGGRDTIQSYGGVEVPERHRDFLQRLSPPIKLEHPFGDVEYVFSHGMLAPTHPLEERFNTHDAQWGRPSSFHLGNKSVKWLDSQVLVFGHTPHKEPTWYYDRALCIDTGAKLVERPLTAVILPPNRDGDFEFLQAEG